MDATEALTEFLARRRDLWPPSSTPPHGLRPAAEGSSGDVWFIESSDGRPCGILRRCELRHAANRLIAAHGLALRVGVVGECRPLPGLTACDRSWWRTRGVGGPVLIEEWIEGASLAKTPENARVEHARAIAVALQVLHQVKPRPGEGPADVKTRAREMLSHRLKAVHDLFTDEEGSALASLAQELLGRLTSELTSVLTHTHLAADDILIRPGGEAVLIDIGSLQFGPRQVDLVDALHSLGLADADPAPLLDPYLACERAAARQHIAESLPLFHLLRDLGKLRARLREGAGAEALAPLRARVLARLGQFPLRSQ